ncbi:MFS transporter [Lysobacter pythonis]|uniref:MFS transporter n=1 Tax=Solilutibacter pythonis TaxID=2483112 RepID=A0A3M2HJT7_9GAMM|nr:MFS transporter [Lysobacter pythonis]RMH88635.1 MFS transporter [Lysobacter pythonis]
MPEPVANQEVSALARLREELADSPPLWWALLYFFCLLCGYYVLRPVRDAMGAAGNAVTVFPRAWIEWAGSHGWALKDFTLQILFTGTFIVMLALQPFYGALVARFPRRVFLPMLYLLFIACLLGFWWAFDRQISGRGAVFFIWVAVFNLFAVSVFWSYMADVFSHAQAKRVYGFIGAGGTIGALVGPAITREMVGRIGVDNLLLISAGFLVVCLLCIVQLRPWAQRREGVRWPGNRGEAMGGSIWAGLRLVARDPLLAALAMLMFFGVGVGTLLYNEQAAIVKLAYPDEASATRFYSTIDWAINIVTIVVQLFVTRWLLRRHGLAPALLIPVFGILIGYCVLAMSPLPLFVAITQVLTRAGEFSLAKPGRETLYTRVDRESRYKAKAFIDTAVYRGGDLGFVWLHKWLATFGSRAVFVAGIGVALAMLASAWQVLRRQKALQEQVER